MTAAACAACAAFETIWLGVYIYLRCDKYLSIRSLLCYYRVADLFVLFPSQAKPRTSYQQQRVLSQLSVPTSFDISSAFISQPHPLSDRGGVNHTTGYAKPFLNLHHPASTFLTRYKLTQTTPEPHLSFTQHHQKCSNSHRAAPSQPKNPSKPKKPPAPTSGPPTTPKKHGSLNSPVLKLKDRQRLIVRDSRRRGQSRTAWQGLPAPRRQRGGRRRRRG